MSDASEAHDANHSAGGAVASGGAINAKAGSEVPANGGVFTTPASGGAFTTPASGGAFTTPASGGAFTTPASSPSTPSSPRVLTVLSRAPKFPVSLATHDGNVYFVDWGTFSNDGAAYGVSAIGAELFRVGNLQGPGGIAANSSGVYWAAVGNLAHAGLDGSNVTTLSSNFVNDPIALGLTGVYGTGSLGSVGAILGVRFGAGPTVSLTANDKESYGLAADADRVYWTTFTNPMAIRSVPLVGGAAVTLATSPGPGGGIAIDAHSVYWVAQGAVMKVSLEGGAPTQLASAAPSGFISGIAVDGTSVYWSSADSIIKVPVEGGAAEVLATGQDVPSAVAVDDTSVYWATVGNPTGYQGTISRLTPK